MPLDPIDTRPLFAPLLEELLTLLRSLSADDWLRPTVAGQWRVRDVAAHLLDGDLRKIAVYRDGHFPPVERPIASERDVAGLVNGLNASGVAFAGRLSPREIVDLLSITGRWVVELVTALPLHDKSIFAVSWAGETASENWMDIGREYSERWHHQMQIRDAAGAPLLLDARWLEPLLDIAVRVLPHAYRDTPAPAGTAVDIQVHDQPRCAWTLVRTRTGWSLERRAAAQAACTVALSADTAWRLFFNALPPATAAGLVSISGDRSLAEPLLRARSVVV